MAPPTPGHPGGDQVTPSSTKRALEEIIDVDVLPATTPAPSTKGKNVAKVARIEEPIDVDDPTTWTFSSPGAAGGSSSAGGLQRKLKFDGALGIALYEQKMEVQMEEAGAAGPAAANMTPTADDEPTTNRPPATPTGAASASGSGSIVTPPDVPVPARAGRFRSKWDRPMLTRPRRKNKFVRRAAVMTAPSFARIVAGPPTPPQSGSESGSESGMGSGEGGASDAGARSGSDGTGASDAGAGSGSGGTVGSGADENGASGSGGASGAGGTGASDSGAASDAGGSGVGVDELGAAEEGDFGAADVYDYSEDASPVVNAVLAAAWRGEADATDDVHMAGVTPTSRRAAADALAEVLASRSRFPQIFPAACWVPAASAAFASASNATAGRPPLPHAAPSATNRNPSPNTSSSPWRAFASGPTPPPPPPPPPPPSTANLPDDESSEEMDDDELVLAYVTPPASPVVSTMPVTSPRRTRPSSGSRRRSLEARPARAVATAAAAASEDVDDPQLLTLDVIHAALRSGFSSVRRELTRLRAELVVVKSQSASALRRMDGIAASADGRESGNGVVLERLVGIDRALSTLGERMPKTSNGEDGGGAAANGQNSVALVTEIKVRALTCFRVCFADGCRLRIVEATYERVEIHARVAASAHCVLTLSAPVRHV